MTPANGGDACVNEGTDDSSMVSATGYSSEHDEQCLVDLAELALAGLVDLEAGRILDEVELDALLGISPLPHRN